MPYISLDELLRDVDGIDGCCVGVRIWELDIVGGGGAEYVSEILGKIVACGVVGPQGEGAGGS